MLSKDTAIPTDLFRTVPYRRYDAVLLEIDTAEEFQLSVTMKVKLFIVDFTTLASIMVITTTALSCIRGLDEDLKESFLLCLHS